MKQIYAKTQVTSVVKRLDIKQKITLGFCFNTLFFWLQHCNKSTESKCALKDGGNIVLAINSLPSWLMGYSHCSADTHSADRGSVSFLIHVQYIWIYMKLAFVAHFIKNKEDMFNTCVNYIGCIFFLVPTKVTCCGSVCFHCTKKTFVKLCPGRGNITSI